MNSRERVLASISHIQPDRVPIGLRFSPEMMVRVMESMRMTEPQVWEWIGQDLVTVRPKFLKAASDRFYADPTIEVNPAGHFLDIYRVPFRQVDTGFQTYLEPAGEPPMADLRAIGELDDFPWPTPELWDFSVIESELETHRNKATWARSRGVFEIAHMMRGMDNLMVDLLQDPELANALMDRIERCLYEFTSQTLEAGKGRYVFYEYNDDVASQRGMMISPGLWREFLKPRMKRFCDLIHSHGAKVRYHSCGSVRAIIPDLIEIGVDILNPVQPLAEGMNPIELKAEFGDRLAFDGGIDTQQLLPKGTANEVRKAVEKMIKVMGNKGGYILAGSHTLQADVPMNNIVAMIEATKR